VAVVNRLVIVSALCEGAVCRTETTEDQRLRATERRCLPCGVEGGRQRVR
jgi:hypothetical protein